MAIEIGDRVLYAISKKKSIWMKVIAASEWNICFLAIREDNGRFFRFGRWLDSRKQKKSDKRFKTFNTDIKKVIGKDGRDKIKRRDDI